MNSEANVKSISLYETDYQLWLEQIPEEPGFTLEQALDEDWLPWQPDPATR